MARFKIEASTQKKGWWVCTDTENLIVCKFKEHQYNETQEFTILEELKNPNPLTIAKAVREMADWLRANHYFKAMPNIK